MSAKDNRDADNLLILCLYHSRLVDDREEEYPPEKLRRWKAEAKLTSGIEPGISDAEIQDILRAMVVQEISISADTIQLGGSLGGGGGAIGYGAFGGRGGDISSFPELKPKPKPPLRYPEGLPFLGAGFSQGYDGQPGGITAVTRNEEVLVAAGGGGGGYVGSGNRSKTDKLSISACLIANSCEVRDGLWYILGGGWESFRCQIPAPLRLVAAVTFEAGGVAEGEYTVHTSVYGPLGQTLGRSTFPFTVEKAAAILRRSRAVVVTCELTDDGPHSLVIETEAAELIRVPFLVIRIEDPGARIDNAGEKEASPKA